MLVTDRDDPLLAQWQYGLGRSIAWTSDSTGRWAKNWIAWQGFSKFFSQMVGWTFPGEESGGIEASFVDRGGRTYLRVESVRTATARGATSTTTTVAMIGPDLEPSTVNLSQVASGVYEAPVANLQSGAYAVRVTQQRAGEAPLGRTLGLVAPTAAEYRLLGANEPLLAAIRAATGGREVATPADAWVHDLQTTSQFTELWPWLLVLALLLWPLDIAFRRVSLGRRELADGRRWVTDRVRGGGSRPARSRSKGCSRPGTGPAHPALGPRSCARPPTARTARGRSLGGAAATDSRAATASRSAGPRARRAIAGSRSHLRRSPAPPDRRRRTAASPARDRRRPSPARRRPPESSADDTLARLRERAPDPLVAPAGRARDSHPRRPAAAAGGAGRLGHPPRRRREAAPATPRTPWRASHAGPARSAGGPSPGPHPRRPGPR